MKSAGSEDRTVKIWDTRTRDAQREFESRAPVTTVTLVQGQNELISGDQDGNIRVWDITAGACSCELVPEVDVAVRSVSVALDGSQVRPPLAFRMQYDVFASDLPHHSGSLASCHLAPPTASTLRNKSERRLYSLARGRLDP